MTPASFIPLAYVLTFVAVVLAVQTAADRLLAARASHRRINRRLTMQAAGASPQDVYERLVRNPAAPSSAGRRLKSLHDDIWSYCRQAGMTTTPTRLALIVLGAAGGLWLLSMALLRPVALTTLATNGLMALIGALGLSVMTAYLIIARRRRLRLKQLEEQLPITLDIITRALRAGHPVVSAVNLAATEMGDPIGSELGLIVDETTYGAAFKDALTSFAVRTGSPDAHFFAVSVAIQSETGGNLVQILDGLAGVVRGRHSLAKRVKALASEGKASGLILSLLPLFVIGAILLMQPQFYSSKFSDPIFWPVAAFIVALYIVGQFIMNKIINFKY